MDTERIVVLNKEERVTMHDLSEDLIAAICDYVEINRHVQEINQLFNDTDSYYENCMRSAMAFFRESDAELETLQKHFRTLLSEN